MNCTYLARQDMIMVCNEGMLDVDREELLREVYDMIHRQGMSPYFTDRTGVRREMVGLR